MSTPQDPESWPYPTTTAAAAEQARIAFSEGCRAPWTRPIRPRDSDAFEQKLQREPSPGEWTRFTIVFGRALAAMEVAPDGPTAWDDAAERWVAHA